MDGSSESSVGAKPVSPRSPPAGSIDLFGKRTQMFKVQALEREIGLLQVPSYSSIFFFASFSISVYILFYFFLTAYIWLVKFLNLNF